MAPGTKLVTALASVVTAALLIGLLLFVSISSADCIPPGGTQPPASDTAGSIPGNYLTLYQQAGQSYGIPWNVLAAVGKIESDHGRSNLPGVKSGENHAGAGGPMQFLADTWKAYGVDGNGDGRKDRYDPADAIPGAANYLRASGAPARMEDALYAYNHSRAYVRSVLDQAAEYAAGGFRVGEDNDSGSICLPGAVGPAGPVVEKAIAWATQQLGTPYYYGGTCTDPKPYYTSTNCDCSSLTQMSYRAAGVSLPRTTYTQWKVGTRVSPGREARGDLVFFRMESAGPGHVGLVLDPGKKLMIHAPRTGKNVEYANYGARGDLVGFVRVTQG